MTDGQQLIRPDSRLISPEGQPTRRSFLRGAAGGAAALAGGAVLLRSGTARASALYSLQGDWAWCGKCSEITYATGAFKGSGTCPAQPYNGHAIGGTHYSEVYNQATTLPANPGYQAGWYFCSQCYAMAWHGTNPAAACPAGSGLSSHNLGSSYNYAIPVGFTGGSYQSGWNYCNACGCLYWSSGGSGTQAGYCWVVWNSTEGIRQQHVPGSATQYRQIL